MTCLAATPALDGFYPAGGPRGSTNRVTATGKSDVWPPKVWIAGDGLEFAAETNKGIFTVRIAATAAPGPRLVRLYNEEGSSDPRVFVIGETREVTEIEPNNHYAKPQRLESLPAPTPPAEGGADWGEEDRQNQKLPLSPILPRGERKKSGAVSESARSSITLNGRLDKSGDVDSFAIHLRAGDWLVARVDCYVLMSKVDAVLRLVTTNGQQLAWNHDFITLDPRLAWQAPTEGDVVLQLFGFAFPPDSGITLTGGDSAVYRLHVAVTNAEPAIGGVPTEHEPNNTLETAEPIELPAEIKGAIGVHGDEDRFRFSLKKNETLDARIDAASFGSPLDAWLKIEDSSGKTLAQNDDVEGARDPRLEWKAPTNGVFVIVIGSVTHRGGRDYGYRLSLQRALPDFTATLASGTLELIPGKTNELKLEVKRLRGFTNDLAVRVRGLPGEITVLTARVPKDGSMPIRFAATADAPKFQGPVQFYLFDTVTQRERLVSFDLTTRGETGFNHLLVETADHFWLTVRPKAEPEKKDKPSK